MVQLALYFSDGLKPPTRQSIPFPFNLLLHLSVPGQCDQTYPWHCEALSGLDILKEMLSLLSVNEILVEVSTVETSILCFFLEMLNGSK